MRKPLQARIYIPFCPRKCLHCHSLTLCGVEPSLRTSYLYALKEEIRASAEGMDGYVLTGICVEGGSPSLCAPRELGELIDTLRDSFPFEKDIEVCLEANPGSITQERLQGFLEAGVNRIFLGICTDNARESKALGLPFDAADAKYGADRMHAEGFHTFSLDLLCGIPYQTVDSLWSSLLNAIALTPAMLSLRPLLLMQGSLYHEHFIGGRPIKGGESLPPLPGAKLTEEMLCKGDEELRRCAYVPYTLYDYAFCGQESAVRSYSGDYIGFGLGAKSCFSGIAYRNTGDLSRYIAASGSAEECIDSIAQLSVQDTMRLFVENGLKRREGFSRKDFKESFGVDLSTVLPCLEPLLEAGLIERDGDRFSMSLSGMASPLEVFSKIAG